MIRGVVIPAALAGIVGYIGILAKPSSSLFSYHPAFMTLAFIGMLSSAVLLLNRDVKLSRRSKTFLHWLLNGLAGIAAAVGFGSIYYNKELNNKPHFTSWHGLIGATACALLLSQLTFGGIMNYPQYAKPVLSYSALRRCHAISGTTVYLLGSGAFIFGLFTTWFQSQASALAIITVIGAQALVLGSILQQVWKGLGVLNKSWKNVKN
ncbi:transmembrane reductase CYB561D2 [Hyalella azteca]|uniref:ascorbate ferrireductase (transmembrane) n=1 Tax=Hyalella azteca TaxID=294128 RepID=A0A8B7P9Y6_HYAAZ|nr:transmembrane reductase CYB561D2 [Hyalella azteca]